jgi:hypothetical protein
MPVKKATAKQVLGSKSVIMLAELFHRRLKMGSTQDASLDAKPSVSKP